MVARALFEENMKAIAAGWNPMSLKRSICAYVEPLLELHDPERRDGDRKRRTGGARRRSICVVRAPRRRSEEMHDIVACTCTQQFYFALVNGQTGQQAFDIARQSIDSLFADNNYLANEIRSPISCCCRWRSRGALRRRRIVRPRRRRSR